MAHVLLGCTRRTHCDIIHVAFGGNANKRNAGKVAKGEGLTSFLQELSRAVKS